ncbi:hypothetical protein [Prevotella intermedia]|uniref:Uncharacterized protein n=1 Tax=Prevotella intermedia TaxID=28131 RepID=A0A2A6EGF6_PREIN|nr:hypothetical protein [Prevotella intermedia]PDP60781.1 hypothetical protein CLI71_03830 [Prevotella intermedia]
MQINLAIPLKTDKFAVENYTYTSKQGTMRINQTATLLLLSVNSSKQKKKRKDNVEFHFVPTKATPTTHLLQQKLHYGQRCAHFF